MRDAWSGGVGREVAGVGIRKGPERDRKRMEPKGWGSAPPLNGGGPPAKNLSNFGPQGLVHKGEGLPQNMCGMCAVWGYPPILYKF